MKIGVVGGAGYVGGELLRILLNHPKAEIQTVTSRQHAGKYVFKAHPNLRGLTQLKFSPLNEEILSKECDIVFLAVPHGSSMKLTPKLLNQGLKVIDLSADYRLKNPEDYQAWYNWKHENPELLKEAVYGLPELYRELIKNAKLIACPGCMASASILGLAPLIKNEVVEFNRIVIDVKIGSSGAGNQPTLASHHPERFGGVRPYKPVSHRHIAEIEQELSILSGKKVNVAFTPHAVNMVRGILATIHCFLTKSLLIPDIWRIYREFYKNEPFIRFVKDREGLYNLPNPKTLNGVNICDLGFELDERIGRIIVFSAIDNLVKGAAGQAVQCFNIMIGIDEKTGLEALSIHPV
ncbi:N-acetyl-gamma-glutamyl-phosphate reductase [Candidatus Bathyarchaeota archaeon]|nr:N-acetyl-gamma-glutamyl-phosphate reductase [Candidatus Bathyarchaeota archaeon]